MCYDIKQHAYDAPVVHLQYLHKVDRGFQYALLLDAFRLLIFLLAYRFFCFFLTFL